jgi:hypothetical protein
MASGGELPYVVIICDEEGIYYAIPQDAIEQWQVPEGLRDTAARLAGESEVTGFVNLGLRAARFSVPQTGDQSTSLNTQTQRYLTEANDAEARVASLLSDYRSLLQQMRK